MIKWPQATNLGHPRTTTASDLSFRLSFQSTVVQAQLHIGPEKVAKWPWKGPFLWEYVGILAAFGRFFQNIVWGWGKKGFWPMVKRQQLKCCTSVGEESLGQGWGLGTSASVYEIHGAHAQDLMHNEAEELHEPCSNVSGPIIGNPNIPFNPLRGESHQSNVAKNFSLKLCIKSQQPNTWQFPSFYIVLDFYIQYPFLKETYSRSHGEKNFTHGKKAHIRSPFGYCLQHLFDSSDKTTLYTCGRI